MTVAITNLKDLIQPGYDPEWGNPRFLDSEGQPVAGIYADVENDDYHAIPALSSSKLKKFSSSPALYYREYVAPLNRNKIASSVKAFAAGTLTHGLVLEPERCNDLYWYHLNPADHPTALHTVDDIKAAITAAGHKPKGTRKSDFIEQLRAVAPEVADTVFDEMANRHLMTWLRSRNLPWMKPDLAKMPDVIQTIEQAYELCAAKGITPVSDQFDDLVVQLVDADPETHTVAKAIADWELGVFALPQCQALLDEFVLDPITYQDGHRARQTVRKHVRANSLLQNGVAELTMIAQDPETGLWVKAKFDWLRYDLISVDLKTTRDTEPDRSSYQFRDLGYDLQDAFYCHVASLLGINIRAFCFVCVEFADMDNCEVYELSERVRSRAEQRRRGLMQELQSCIARDFWYGYNPSQTTMVLDW